MILKYNEYLNEAVTNAKQVIELSEDKFRDIFKKHCNNFSIYNDMIYKGIEAPKVYDFGIFNPKIARVAIGFNGKTNNFYNCFCSGHPSWSEYPKRSNSLMCSNEEDVAMRYAKNIEDHVYIVVPFDDADIGVAPEGDFIYSFLRSGIIADNLADEFKNIFEFLEKSINKLGADIKIPPVFKNYADVVKFSKELDSDLKRLYNSNGDYDNFIEFAKYIGFKEIEVGEYMEEYLDTKKPFLDIIAKILDPKINGFDITNYDSGFSYNFKRIHEVWIGTKPCLLIKKVILDGDSNWLYK